MRAIVFLVALVAFAAIAEGTIASNVALSVRLLAHKDECFLEDVPAAGTKVYLHFMVTSGGQLDVDASIFGPDSQLIWSADKEREARVLFKARLPGVHKVCFSNKMSTVTAKTVAFNLQVGDPAEDSKGHSVDPMERSIIHIAEGLTEIKNEQNYLRTRERIHRDTVESTNSRVMYWSVAEIALILAMGIGQVLYLKRCFETRRNV